MFRSDAATRMANFGIGTLVRRFCADTSGATAIEYALVAAGIGVAIASAVWKLGAEVKTTLYEKLVSMF